MAPESGELPARRSLGLRDLILVMRKDEIGAAAVNVQRLTKEIDCHRRALEVPTRTAAPPWRVPRRLRAFVLWFCRFPEREVLRVLFGIVVLGYPRAGSDLPPIELREFAVRRKAIDREVDRVVLCLICDAPFDKLRNESHHLRDIVRGLWVL